jgi:hypothetical protein
MRNPRRATLYLVELRRIEQERIEAAKEEWRQADWGRGLFDPPARRLRPIHAAAAVATLSRPKKLLVMSGRITRPASKSASPERAAAMSPQLTTSRAKPNYSSRFPPGRSNADHTEAPASLRGTGAALEVEHAISDVRASEPSCSFASPPSASCCEGSAIPRELSSQTLRGRSMNDGITIECIQGGYRMHMIGFIESMN